MTPEGTYIEEQSGIPNQAWPQKHKIIAQKKVSVPCLKIYYNSIRQGSGSIKYTERTFFLFMYTLQTQYALVPYYAIHNVIVLLHELEL